MPVVDSFAWATFNRNGEVAYEQVWWPELRPGLVAEARAFQAALRVADFRNSLTGSDGDGQLAIHHATPTGERWYSTVSFDVPRKGAEPKHFGVDGKEIRLAAWDDHVSTSRPQGPAN